MPLVLKNGRVFKDNSLINIDILIEEGKIKKLGADIRGDNKDNIIDASGLIILPGLIDCHVHFREPGQSHKEDFLTGSKAAAKGGVTTVLVMPNTRPAILDNATLDVERQLAQKSIVNYGLYMVGGQNSDEIKKATNICGVKVYMDITTGLLKVDDSELDELFASFPIIAVHAEGENVGKALRMRGKVGSTLYLCHVSTQKEIETIKQNKNPRIFCEVTPHHLFLSVQDLKTLGSFGIMKPHLRSPDDINALWQAINDNIIDTIATDHAPHTIEEKKQRDPPFGVPGLETMLPLLLDAVNKGKLTLKKLVELTSHNPAHIFGIKSKGKLSEGYDADLVLVDMALENEVKNNELATKCGWSPFNGWKLKGWPVMTLVNGNIVYDRGVFYEQHKGKEIESSVSLESVNCFP